MYEHLWKPFVHNKTCQYLANDLFYLFVKYKLTNDWHADDITVGGAHEEQGVAAFAPRRFHVPRLLLMIGGWCHHPAQHPHSLRHLSRH